MRHHHGRLIEDNQGIDATIEQGRGGSKFAQLVWLTCQIKQHRNGGGIAEREQQNNLQ